MIDYDLEAAHYDQTRGGAARADAAAGAVLKLGPAASDDAERVRELAAAVGLADAGTVGYVGHGQGRSPREWARRMREEIVWAREADPARVAEICDALEALPDQEVRRADPEYLLAGFRLGQAR